MRSLLHFSVIVNLLFSFAQAPFQHTHASDPHHEHAQGLTHTHWNNTPQDASSSESDHHDSDALMLDWLAGDGSAPVKFVVAVPESVIEPVLTIHVAPAPELSPSNHDPPTLLNLSLRGPPA